MIAGDGLIRNEGGERSGRGFVGGDGVEHFSQALAIALTVRGTAKFRIPQDPERTDLFAAIQTGQGMLSSTRSTAAVTQLRSLFGSIMDHPSP